VEWKLISKRKHPEKSYRTATFCRKSRLTWPRIRPRAPCGKPATNDLSCGTSLLTLLLHYAYCHVPQPAFAGAMTAHLFLIVRMYVGFAPTLVFPWYSSSIPISVAVHEVTLAHSVLPGVVWTQYCVCDETELSKLKYSNCVLVIIHRPVFLFKTTFRRLDSISVFK
jgi:hypothetical protein